jgi:YVTN family beta-propeller protein
MALSLTPNNGLSLNVLDSLSLVGAEISAFDKTSKKFFVTTPNSGLLIVDASNPLDLRLSATINLTAAPFSFTNDVNSVAVNNGVIAVAVANNPKTGAGKVFLLDSDGNLLNSLTVGALPDMLTFTPDGKKILVANEGEASSPDGTTDPEGSVSVIDLSAGVEAATVQTANFTAFDGTEAALRKQGVRIFQGKSVSADVEPEYIAVAPDGKTALVTLQEANAVAIIDIATAKITKIVPLGLKKYQGFLTDFSDRDGASGAASYNAVSEYKVYGMYMPDSIVAFQSKGGTYYAIANEGDDRDDFISGGEKARLSTLTLDATTFPNAADLKSTAVLGRMNTPSPAQVGASISGDTDGDGDIDTLLSYGARSFSILDAKSKVIFDSADHIERFISTQGIFSTGGAFDDTRSDDKGPEPEGLTIATVSDRTYAFVGLERGGGGVMVYDVTDVKNVQFVTYARSITDISPEGLAYVSPANSPTGQALLAVSNEVSNTLTVYAMTRIVQGSVGADRLLAAAGVDEMTGGKGKDQFIFTDASFIGTAAGSRDRITDFTSRTDRIDLRTIDADSTTTGNQNFELSNDFQAGDAGRIVISRSDGVLLISGDTNGDAAADFVIELAGVSSIVGSDLVL